MTTDATTLLRALGGSSGAPKMGAPGPARAPAGAGAFADMLAKARAGELTSGMPVTVARGIDLKLTDEQLQRISVAADRAQAAGISRAVVLIDGAAFTVDVGVRQVTGVAELSPGAALAGIDGVVKAPDPLAASKPTGPASALNASLARALSARPS